VTAANWVCEGSTNAPSDSLGNGWFRRVWGALGSWVAASSSAHSASPSYSTVFA
jgi:hypothetical protein